MKIKPIIPIVSVLIFLALATSCSDQKKEDKAGNLKGEITNKLQEKINLDTIKTVELSEKSKKVTEEWIKYIALNSEMERLENYTVLDVINNASTIENVIDSLEFTISKVFDTKAIKARIITLETHSKLLEENSERVEPNPSEIKELSAKLKLDFNNLNIQLNEVFIIEDNTFQTN
ncbi:MAG: hypothetical protein R6V36_01220 [Psychroflexus sp.]